MNEHCDSVSSVDIDLSGYIHREKEAAGSIEPDKWQHLCLTWDASTGARTLYKDGAIVAETNSDSSTFFVLF